METGHFLDIACLAQFLGIRDWSEMAYLMDICNRAGLCGISGIASAFVLVMGCSMNFLLAVGIYVVIGSVIGVVEPGAEAAATTDVDAVVPIVADSGATYVYWELGSGTLRRMQQRQPQGRAVIRVVVVTPSWEGAQRSEHQHEVEAARGSVTIDPAGPGAVVRAALGWQSAETFRPLAIGAELSAAGEAPARWLPERHRGDRLRPAQQRALASFRQSALCAAQPPAA